MLERIFQEPKFRVCCLGPIKLVEAGSGTDMTPTSRKTRALLGYLCVAGKPVGRERLASLLWGDRGDEQARASLRQAIYELRSLLGGERLLKVERDTVAVGDDVGTDVAAIMAAAKSGDLGQLGKTLSEWRGDFFDDLPSMDPAFDAWLQSERPRIQENLISAAMEAVKQGVADGKIDSARKVVNLLQQHDGTNEVVLRLGLRLDHFAGESAALHRRYERFREQLKSELDAAPAAETQRLFAELAAKPSDAPPSNSGGDANARLAQSDETSPATPVQPAITRPAGVAARETPLPDSRARSSRRARRAAALLVITSLCALAWAVWSISRNSAPSRRQPLLAVMPFQSLSADAASRDFSDSITKEIADALQKTTKVRVSATPSRFPDESTPKAPAATHVLSGSVERIGGDRFHVIAQLMDIADDRVVWSHAYDPAGDQTPALRHKFAAEIAGALGGPLASGSFGETRPAGGAAYDHYLTGRHLFLKNELRAATAEFEKSVGLTPGFASAWSSLAAARLGLATGMFSEHRDTDAATTARAARAAAERALALDRDNGEAQGVLAMLTPATRLSEIEGQFQRAMRSAPGNAQLLVWHSEFLMYVGRNHEALNELKRAYILNPAIPSVAPDLVLASLKSGRVDEARDVMDLIDRGRDTRLHTAFYYLRLKYFLYMRNWFGLATYLSAPPDHLSPNVAAFLRLCRETAIAFATRETDRFDRLRTSWRKESTVDLDDTVEFLSALGDDSGALDAVQSAVRSRRNNAFLTDPQWEALFGPDLVPLRSDPRVPALLARWGLTDYWQATNRSPDYTR